MNKKLGEYELKNLSRLNIVLGKNGVGKSRFMQTVMTLLNECEEVGLVRYISPERGGQTIYNAAVAEYIANNESSLGTNRTRNQMPDFRQQSVALFQSLELLVLRKLEVLPKKEWLEKVTFQSKIDQINSLLERICITRRATGAGLDILDKRTKEIISHDAISSGEAELISLGIEFLTFAEQTDPLKKAYLLIDEPDVHLHPDLQCRIAALLIDIVETHQNIIVIIATHSTALLAAISEHKEAKFAFKHLGSSELDFRDIDTQRKKILPIFGAHPLSNLFNRSPILLVEGEDEERIWQQAVRSSEKKINVYPCSVDSKYKMGAFEKEADELIKAVYDKAVGFSIRDRDDDSQDIEDIGNVVRMKLSCRTSENLILTNEALAVEKIVWVELSKEIDKWLNDNINHQYYKKMKSFADAGYDRKNHDLKDIRNILIGLYSEKSWEVLAGRAIAKAANDEIKDISEHSVRDYLGEKACKNLLPV